MDTVASRQRRRGLRRGLLHGVLAALVLTVVATTATLSPGGATPGVRVVPQFPTEPQERLDELVATEEPPNVVFVLTDDQNTDELQWMPHTQRLLVEEGVTFTDAVSPHPLCCPARALMLTGQYAQNNGVQHNAGPYGGFQALAPTGRTIPERFRDAGYRTGLVGKYLNKYETGPQEPEPGWDLWDPLTKGVYSYDRYSFYGDEATWERAENPYVTNAIARRTNNAVRDMAAGDAPFMMFSWHVAPHYKPTGKVHGPPPGAPRDRNKFGAVDAPSLAKPNYNQRDVSRQPLPIRTRPVMRDKKNTRMFRGRIRALQSVDRAVASLVRTLEETGELDNTYIVFSSDNGYAMGEHRLFGKNVLIDEILDVPLVVRGPGITPESATSAPSSLLDLPATLLDLADVDARDDLDGTSLLGPMLGERVPFRDTMLVQTGSRGFDGWQYRGVRTSRYLYATDENRGEAFLYDESVDPWQMDNVVADPRYAGVVAELEDRAARLRTCSGPGCNLEFGPDPAPRAAP